MKFLVFFGLGALFVNSMAMEKDKPQASYADTLAKCTNTINYRFTKT